jgi:hypothetical protein
MEARRLNESTYYLLHPSLQTLIARQRTNERYKAFKFVVVGHGCEWHRYNETLIDVQRELPGLNGIDPAASKIVDEALPYLHAAWSENRDVTEYMPYGEWKKLTRLASKAKKGGQELLHRALGSARGNGASRRRRTKRPASTPQGEGEGPR